MNKRSCGTCWKYHTEKCEPAQCIRKGRATMWEERPPDKWGTCKKCGHKLYAVRTVTYNSETSHGFLICKNPDCVVAKCKEFKQREFYLNDGTRI